MVDTLLTTTRNTHMKYKKTHRLTYITIALLTAAVVMIAYRVTEWVIWAGQCVTTTL